MTAFLAQAREAVQNSTNECAKKQPRPTPPARPTRPTSPPSAPTASSSNFLDDEASNFEAALDESFFEAVEAYEAAEAEKKKGGGAGEATVEGVVKILLETRAEDRIIFGRDPLTAYNRSGAGV